MVPYILGGLLNPLTRETTRDTLEQLGKLYEEENSDKVMEMKQYGVDEKLHSISYEGFNLPEGYTNRPSLGTRLFVKGVFRNR